MNIEDCIQLSNVCTMPIEDWKTVKNKYGVIENYKYVFINFSYSFSDSIRRFVEVFEGLEIDDCDIFSSLSWLTVESQIRPIWPAINSTSFR